MRARDPHLHDARREAILAAAAACFLRRGFHASSMKDICAAAGMSAGTLYHYFPSKAAIVAGILERDRRATQALLAELDQAAGLRAGLSAALDTLERYATEEDLRLQAEIAAEILRDPVLRAEAAAQEAEARAGLAARLEAAAATGEITPAVGAATAIAALLDGILWAATLRGPAHLAAARPALEAALDRLLEPRP